MPYNDLDVLRSLIDVDICSKDYFNIIDNSSLLSTELLIRIWIQSGFFKKKCTDPVFPNCRILIRVQTPENRIFAMRGKRTQTYTQATVCPISLVLGISRDLCHSETINLIHLWCHHGGGLKIQNLPICKARMR